MMEKSLPLLDWQPPCQLLVFPLERRVGKIRRVVDLLEVKQGVEADSYWRTIFRGLAEQLARSGIPEATIGQELQAFSEAVQLELARRWAGRYPYGNDGA